MTRRRKDKFMMDMGRIHRARRRRQALREEQGSNGLFSLDSVTDEFGFRAQEFGALGKEVGRGLVRESFGLVTDFLKVGTSLAFDVLTGVATLGLSAQPSASSSNVHRKRRRRR